MKKRRISSSEFQKRILELETVYGQRGLAKKLGVSTDTIRRYRSGKTQPNEKLYNKVNHNYSKSKSVIDPEKVRKKSEAIKKRSTAQKTGKRKERQVPIDPDYIYRLSSDFEIHSLTKLEQLAESGFVAGYMGFTEIPIEVQFLIHGEKLTRFGHNVNLVGLVKDYDSPKGGFSAFDTIAANRGIIRIFKIPEVVKRYSMRMNQDDDFDTRIDKARNFYFSALTAMIDNNIIPVAFLGFYFEEGDEI